VTAGILFSWLNWDVIWWRFGVDDTVQFGSSRCVITGTTKFSTFWAALLDCYRECLANFRISPLHLSVRFTAIFSYCAYYWVVYTAVAIQGILRHVARNPIAVPVVCSEWVLSFASVDLTVLAVEDRLSLSYIYAWYGVDRFARLWLSRQSSAWASMIIRFPFNRIWFAFVSVFYLIICMLGKSNLVPPAGIMRRRRGLYIIFVQWQDKEDKKRSLSNRATAID
jgi:hypothetical protein